MAVRGAPSSGRFSQQCQAYRELLGRSALLVAVASRSLYHASRAYRAGSGPVVVRQAELDSREMRAYMSLKSVVDGYLFASYASLGFLFLSLALVS